MWLLLPLDRCCRLDDEEEIEEEEGEEEGEEVLNSTPAPFLVSVASDMSGEKVEDGGREGRREGGKESKREI